MEHCTKVREARERRFKVLVFLIPGMVVFQAAIIPAEFLEWDYVVRVAEMRVAGAVLLTAGALLCMLGTDVLLWRLNSLTGDRDLRNYWLYCVVMAALCWMYSNLDGEGGIFLFMAAFSTPIAPVGTLLASVLNGAKHELCCGACLAFCLAKASIVSGCTAATGRNGHNR